MATAESSPRSLAGRHALVTGASRGIGAAIARGLAAEGARVTLLGRDEAALRAEMEAGSGEGFVIADVTNAEALLASLSAAVAARGQIEILVNNAGSASTAPFLKTDAAVFQRMFEVHVLAAVHTSKFVLPGMLGAGFGRIVNVGSTASLKGARYISAYAVAKHGLLGLTRTLALETAKTGVTVNAVCPGYTETDMVRGSLQKTMNKTGRPYDELLGEILAENPLGRLVKPEEVAAAVVWLCGEGAASVTGQAIAIDGGETAGR
jgi:NAD(P)-dependent dehydrogenase (short-subunit alcohol dehydrogenase family)